jgi:hypothetical protein
MNDLELMIKSKDKDTIYLAYQMLKFDKSNIIKNKKKLLDEIDLFDKIKNYSDVCFELDIDELTIDSFNFITDEKDRLKIFRFYQIKQIEKVFNQNWIIDWSNTNQYKYYPWFKLSSSSGLVGFAGSAYDHAGSCAGVGFFKNSEISNYVGKTFIDIYTDIIK